MCSEIFVFFLPVLADGASDSDSNPSDVLTWLRQDSCYSRCARFADSLRWCCCRGFSWSVSLGSLLSDIFLVSGGHYLCSLSAVSFSGWLLDGLSSPCKSRLVNELVLHCLTLSMSRSSEYRMYLCSPR